MKSLTPGSLWAWLAAGSAAAVAASFVMTGWLGLDPCHYCIAQRLLFMVLALLGLGAAVGARSEGTALAGRLIGAATLPVSSAGLSIAGYQSWMQRQPPDSVSCVSGTPGLIERGVEWLGRQAPDLFLATGFCEDVGLSILGLSLADWASVLFALGLGLGILALVRSREGAAPRPPV